MPRRLTSTAQALVLTAVVSIAGCKNGAPEAVSPAVTSTAVARVGDGDSIELEGGERVRLLQIDAPELGEGECYGDEAYGLLETLLPPGSAVTLERDPSLDDRDRFARLLRYVVVDGLNVNVELVRRGAATPYFFGTDEGRHADELLAALDEARDERRGMWAACVVDWSPTRQVATTYR